MKIIQPLLIFLTTSCLISCGPATQITGSWKNEKLPRKAIKSIMVTALTARANARQTIENDLAAALENDKYSVVKSLDVIPPTFTQSKEPDKETLMKSIKGKNVDAILTVALINQETENRYVPGRYSYAPATRFVYYGRFWGYYNTWYPTLYEPGYYTEEKIYFLETNLYDARTEGLLWSAQSQTSSLGTMTAFARDFTTAVLARMKKDGVLQ